MPLSKGTSAASREKNVEKEIAAGKDPKQAVAIAYSQQRANKKAINDLKETISRYEAKK